MKKFLIACSVIIMLLCLNLTVFAAYLGDIDGNGTLTASDARAILRHSAKLESIAEEILPLADVDKNGNVNAADARLALRMGAKLDELIEDHTHDYKTTEIQKQDCEKDGIIEYRCSVCDHSYQDVTKATGHNYTSAVTKEPTCGAVGVKEYTCSVCNHTYSEDIEALEHDYIKITEREPSCATGLKEFECSICGDIYTEESPAILPNHRFTQFEVIKTATCGEDGLIEYTCEVCGEKKQEEIEKTARHSYDSGVITKQPTYEDDGERIFTCKICGDSYSVTVGAAKYTSGIYIHMPEAPILVSEYNYGNIVKNKFKITDLSYELIEKNDDGTWDINIVFTGEKIYDISGNVSDSCSVGCKLYDMEGYVARTGIGYTKRIKTGDKVKDEHIWLSSLKPGEYRLEILDVR